MSSFSKVFDIKQSRLNAMNYEALLVDSINESDIEKLILNVNITENIHK